MAAIGLRFPLLMLVAASAMMADQAHDVLHVVNNLTTALGDNDAPEAMSYVDRSFAGYDRMAADLGNLTAGYSISNEADVIDEDDTADESKLTLDWSLTLRSQGTGQTVSRHEQVLVRLVCKGKRWKIVDFAPLKLFDPQM